MTETSTGRCDWASCRATSCEIEDGWRLCRRHLYEHRRLRATDVVAVVERGPLSSRPSRPEPEMWLWAKFSGDLQPSGTFGPILAVLNRHPGRKDSAA